MTHLKEIYENNYVSINSFDAEADETPFKFALCVDVVNLWDACGDKGFLIYVQAAKLPEYLTQDQKKSVADCMSIEIDEITVSDVCQYGLNATFDSYKVDTENEVEAKLEEIDGKIDGYGGLCGFYFDKQMNALGNDGWDFINGNIGFKRN